MRPPECARGFPARPFGARSAEPATLHPLPALHTPPHALLGLWRHPEPWTLHTPLHVVHSHCKQPSSTAYVDAGRARAHAPRLTPHPLPCPAPQAALCALLGSAASYAYLALLYRDIDAYTGDTVVPSVEADKVGMCGWEGVQGLLGRARVGTVVPSDKVGLRACGREEAWPAGPSPGSLKRSYSGSQRGGGQGAAGDGCTGRGAEPKEVRVCRAASERWAKLGQRGPGSPRAEEADAAWRLTQSLVVRADKTPAAHGPLGPWMHRGGMGQGLPGGTWATAPGNRAKVVLTWCPVEGGHGGSRVRAGAAARSGYGVRRRAGRRTARERRGSCTQNDPVAELGGRCQVFRMGTGKAGGRAETRGARCGCTGRATRAAGR